eukprot:3579279-Prymnesium_polylepis.1
MTPEHVVGVVHGAARVFWYTLMTWRGAYSDDLRILRPLDFLTAAALLYRINRGDYTSTPHS